MRYFISAGEASGDIHAAALIRELRRIDGNATFGFLGGDLMAEAAGIAPLIHYREMAFMGFSEVLRHLGKVLGNLSTAKKAMLNFQPDALILVDYPSFNLKLAKAAKRAGVKVFYFISPKVWAWKQWRVKAIKRNVDSMLSILPFEKEFYRRHDYEITYVGNPSVGEIDSAAAALPAAEDFRSANDLDTTKPIMALVAGSRVGEIRNNLPVMEAVARRFPNYQAVIAGAPAIEKGLYSSLTDLPVVDNATFALMRHADIALVTSGTATLECALLGTPQVACYRSNGSALTYKIMRWLVSGKYVTLPNLITDEEIIPEMLFNRCSPDLVATEVERILPDTDGRRAQLEGYRRMRDLLGDNDAAATAAKAIIDRCNIKNL